MDEGSSKVRDAVKDLMENHVGRHSLCMPVRCSPLTLPTTLKG
jgi:hypothetical protein